MSPIVSFVVPTHNNEATIVRTLNSLLEQTLRDIEVVLVDDASTDGTVELCRQAARLDSRVMVEELQQNQTVLQARRIGVERATGTYIMFCDSDDEFEPHAAEVASSFAMGGGYDIVHFGTKIVSTTGSKHEAWEKSLAPFGTELFGDDILRSSSFGQSDVAINGNIWNKLYERALVQRAWAPIDPSLQLPRAQDIFQTLLLLATATRYGGLGAQLYRYNFGAGKSGNVADRGSFQHFVAAARTYRAVEEHVGSAAWPVTEAFDVGLMLSRLRTELIANQLNYWFKLPRPASEALGDLLREWDPADVLQVLADRHAGESRVVVEAVSRLTAEDLGQRFDASAADQTRRVALLGNIAGLGGVQKVLGVQAGILIEAGYEVTILAFDHAPEDLMLELAPGVELRSIGERTQVGVSVAGLIRAVRELGITVLLNHDNYSPVFPWIAVAARLLGLRSALFLHNFALRSMLDFRAVFAYFPEIALSYNTTVTLSAADRAWWEASGVRDVRVLPNFGPATTDVTADVSLETGPQATLLPESVPRPVDLLWVGRLHNGTKNLSGLLDAFSRIVAQRPDTTLAIVGGEQTSGELTRLEKQAQKLGVRNQVLFAGSSHNVGAWYRSARVFVVTADIEGFNLTLVEAQASGLPVVMYDLPYLETVNGNPGIVAVEWGASAALADAAIALLADPERAAQLAVAGREFAARFSFAAYAAGLGKIVGDLNGESGSALDTADSIAELATVPVPVSVIGELYRLYGRMHTRMSGELRRARTDSENLRKNLSQLKQALAETKSKQQQLENVIAQVERAKPAPKPRGRKAVAPSTADAPEIGGIWPLWARHEVQPFDVPVQSPFADIATTDAALLPAVWAIDSGVLDMDAPRAFGGEGIVARLDFIRMLHRLAGSPVVSFDSAPYGDLDGKESAISWAIGRDIISTPAAPVTGTALPVWKPGNPLLRRSAALLLYRAAGQPHYRPPAVSPYADITAGQQLYREMCWAAHQGVLIASRSKDGALVFDEHHRMTRIETATALFRQMVGPLIVAERG